MDTDLQDFAVTAGVKLYYALKADIISCELAPGTSFSESDLTRRYEVSRTPVREACRRLCDEGLIDIVAFRGYSVAPLTVTELFSLQELQLICDPQAAALAAQRADPGQIRRLKSFATYEYRVGVKASYYQFLDNNRSLHVGIAEATGNQELVRVVATVHTKLLRYFYLGLSMDAYGQQLVNEHVAILDAIAAHDEDSARSRTSEHIQNTIQRSTHSMLVSPLLQGTQTGTRSGLSMQIGVRMNPSGKADGSSGRKGVAKTRVRK